MSILSASTLYEIRYTNYLMHTLAVEEVIILQHALRNIAHLACYDLLTQTYRRMCSVLEVG